MLQRDRAAAAFLLYSCSNRPAALAKPESL